MRIGRRHERRLATLGLLVLSLAAIQSDVLAATSPPDWAGFYVGVSAGGRFANNDWTTTDIAPTVAQYLTIDPNPSASFDNSAARVGGYFGCNWYIAPSWIAGLEADVGWANNRDSRTPVPGTVQSFVPPTNLALTNQPQGTVKETWDAGVRGRIGTLITPDTLVFAAVGPAWQHVELNAVCTTDGGETDWCAQSHNETATATRLGWTAGGGIERMLGHWIVRLEYRYADFGTFSHTFFTDTPAPSDDSFTANVDVRTQTVSLGVAYQFDAP